METLLASTLVVALAEIGDKTMLLAIVLASRFRRPIPIIMGILVATLANHAIAAFLGTSIAGLLSGQWFQIAVAISFIAMAGWTLIPDKFDDDTKADAGRFGAFLTTAIAFFVVEIGDKTQIATIALAAKYQSVLLVTAGTTLGMMLANAPAVYLGDRITKIIPLHYVRMIAAAIFAMLGVITLINALK